MAKRRRFSPNVDGLTGRKYVMDKIQLERKLRLGTIRRGVLRSYNRLKDDVKNDSEHKFMI